ncbi:unnamed protein product [Mytilus coruscus]|uniref:Uncharacterized protein n=1 Tax=Mytilus coruscus TaxID=42192 RepID=A0A6J8E7C7_MYTCO|nr:unnamed protein product [Mytilus coruscus]
MVVQHQPDQQDLAVSLQQQQVLDLTTFSHDHMQHLNVEKLLVPHETNFQHSNQQVINRPQPVINSHQQHKFPITIDEIPSDHVHHFPPSVQNENVFRQEEQLVTSHLQHAFQAYYRSSPSEIPYKQHRGAYKTNTPTVERVKHFSLICQHEDFHRQQDFNTPVHQTSECSTCRYLPSTRIQQPSTTGSQSQNPAV